MMMEDWQTGKTVVKCLEYVLDKKHLMDVDFRFVEENPIVSLSAHRLILSLRSPIFEAMFFGSPADIHTQVEITDVESSAFIALLRYIYTDEVELTLENITKVFRASHKYSLRALTEKCSKFLIKLINSANVCELLNSATLYGVKDLQHHCMVFIDFYNREVMKTAGFLNLSRYNMERILCGNTIQADEAAIYEAVMAWTEAECKRQSLDHNVFDNRRSIAGSLIKLIRFPLIHPKKFAEDIADHPHGLLTHPETIRLFQIFTSKSNMSQDFANIPRKEDINLEVSRFEEKTRSRFWYQGIEDEFKLSSNRELVLTGVILKGSIQQCGCSARIEGSLEILDYNTPEAITIYEMPLFHEKRPSVHNTDLDSNKEVIYDIRMDFSTTIFILPEKIYGLHLKIKPNFDECECNEICDCYDVVSNRQPRDDFISDHTVIMFRNTGEAIVKTLLFNYWR